MDRADSGGTVRQYMSQASEVIESRMGGSRTLSRGLALLQAISTATAGASVSQLSQSTGLDRAVIYRLLETLIEQGFVTRDDEQAVYRLGLALLEIGNVGGASVTDAVDETEDGTMSTSPDWLARPSHEFEAAYPFTNRAAPIHMRLCRALASVLANAPSDSSLGIKPLSLAFSAASSGPDMPLFGRFYAFRATQHATERQPGAFRIQISHVREGGGKRHYFDRSNGFAPFLVGYVPELDVWILWDADLHDRRGFTYSRGIQAPSDLIYRAASGDVETSERTLKAGLGRETIVAATSYRLEQAISLRQRISIERIIGS